MKEKAIYMNNLLIGKVKKVELVSSLILSKIEEKMTQQKECMKRGRTKKSSLSRVVM